MTNCIILEKTFKEDLMS